jgi:hypothetical protein
LHPTQGTTPSEQPDKPDKMNASLPAMSLTMTPREQREHLFAIREQDAPSPYTLARTPAMTSDSLIIAALIDAMTRREANGDLYTARDVLSTLRGAADIHDRALSMKIGAYLDESRAAHIALICK